jgi:hypothetical protein
MNELVKKVRVACAFGTPDAATAHEIIDEVQTLITELDETRGKHDEIRTVLEKAFDGALHGDDLADGEMPLRLILEVLDR